MNGKYNSSDFVGMNLTATKQIEHYETRQKLQQVSISAYNSVTEKRIENMLLSHNRYYIYYE